MRATHLFSYLIITLFSISVGFSQCDFTNATQYSGGSSTACACTWMVGTDTHCAYGNCSNANRDECLIDCGGAWFQGAGNAGQVQCSIVLPVGLESFYGSQNGHNAELIWKTVTEVNNERFDVYYSSDGSKFKFLTSIKGAGTTDEERSYHFIHNEPGIGTHYYKLIQYDFNGASEETDVISIQISATTFESSFSSPYPNPADQYANTSFRQELSKGAIQMWLYKFDGTLIKHRQYDSAAFGSVLSINVGEVEEGVYLLKTSYLGKEEVSRIMVKH